MYHDPNRRRCEVILSITRSGTWSDIDPFELLKIVADVLGYNLMLTTTMMMMPLTMVTMRMIAEMIM